MTGGDPLQRLPMFPLGAVLLPGVLLPMQIFEPRYKALVADVAVWDEPGFGIVLIERGSEVGGGETRRMVGTFGRIVQSEETDDGRTMLVVGGTDRIVVHEWLDDDPYPVAMVERHRLDPPDMSESEYEQVMALTRQVLAARTELGQPAAPVTLELAPDAALGFWQCISAAKLGPVDTWRPREQIDGGDLFPWPPMDGVPRSAEVRGGTNLVDRRGESISGDTYDLLACDDRERPAMLLALLEETVAMLRGQLSM